MNNQPEKALKEMLQSNGNVPKRSNFHYTQCKKRKIIFGKIFD